MGRKNRCAYWRNATSVPRVRVSYITRPPPNQRMSAAASALMISIAG